MDVVPAKVISNRAETSTVHRLSLAYDAVARGARAARFLMLSVFDAYQQVMPRPFSVSDVYRSSDGTVVTEVLYKPVGRVTRALAGLRSGDLVQVGGLLGNGFPDPAPSRRPVLMAGGIGNAPFAYQVRTLVAGRPGRDPRDIVLLLAARGADDIYIQPVVRELGVTVVEITEDGSRGERGRITDVLMRRLDTLGPIEGFACGPEPMLKAIQSLALEHGFPCWLSVEERMACGYGVCNACVVEERCPGTPKGEGWYLRGCTAGPVFEAREIYA